jgi:hypothetical protein
MDFLLGKAEGPDPTDSNLVLVVIAMATVAVVCILAAIPVATCRRRRLGQTEGIAALMVVWGLLAAGSAIWFANAQISYSREYTMRIMEDYDARDTTGRPNKPWLIWGFLAAAYGGAILWSATAKSGEPTGFPVDPSERPAARDSDAST